MSAQAQLLLQVFPLSILARLYITRIVISRFILIILPNIKFYQPRWSSGYVLSSGLKGRGINPDQGGDGFLWALRSLSVSSFGGEVKQSAPCRRFTACKRTLRM
jgi:hypothetical protein